MKVQNYVFWIIGSLLWVTAGCKHDPTTPGPVDPGSCDTLSVTYPGDVIPIFSANCTGCHSGVSPEAGINLTDFDQVAALAQSGTLLGVIKHSAGFSPMPKNQAKLSDCDIVKIEIWIRDTTFTNNPGGIPCDPDTIYFQNTVLPLLQSSCAIQDCHDVNGASEGVILTDYTQVMNTGGIQPGNPQDSEIYEKMTEDDPDKIMPPPPRSPLTAAQTNLVYQWILQGAKNNYCESDDCDSVNVTFSQVVWPVIQNRCFGCHSGSFPSGGISLDSWENVKTIAGTGQLLGVITHASGYSPMPKNGSKLSNCNIAQIRKWINDGTPNN